MSFKKRKLKKEKKKKIKIILALILLITTAVIFYYRLGIGFGEATVKTVKTIEEVKVDFKDKNIDPIDTIIKQNDKILDSIKSKDIVGSLKTD